MAKSSMVFSKKVHDAEDLTNILEFKVQSLPFKYLDMPITGKLISNRDCASLIADLKATNG